MFLTVNENGDGMNSQQKVFTIANPSTIDINITHIGFDQEEKACRVEGISIDKELCHGFVIKSGS